MAKQDLKGWADATYAGSGPVMESLRMAVMCMVTLTQAMLQVTTQKPLKAEPIMAALVACKELISALEELYLHVHHGK